jgi:hypothetical protein
MNGGRNEPRLKATGLWAKSSVKGGQYLTGRLSGVKVLSLENRDRKTDDEPSHHLFFVEAAPRQGAQKRGQDRVRDHQAPLPGNTTPPRRPPTGDDEVPPWER